MKQEMTVSKMPIRCLLDDAMVSRCSEINEDLFLIERWLTESAACLSTCGQNIELLTENYCIILKASF